MQRSQVYFYRTSILIYSMIYQFNEGCIPSNLGRNEDAVLWRAGSEEQHVAPGPTHVREEREQRHFVNCESRKTAVFLKQVCYFL